MKPRVLIGPAHLKEIPSVYQPPLIAAGLDMVIPNMNTQLTEAELLAELPGCTASLAGSERYTRAVIAAAKELKIIARAGVGYDAVDLNAATEHGIVVTIAPGTNQEAVGEQTLGVILALAKSLLTQDTLIKQGKWPRRPYLPLRGKTLGIIGLGRTGKATARRAQAFSMNVIAHDPYTDRAFADAHGIPLLPRDDVFRQADWVTLHLPLTEESRQFINAHTLGLMKPSAFLINASRGGVVNEADLYDALKNRRIAGAALDVLSVEPPGDNPLLTLENVLLTAHTAGVDLQSRDDMARSAATTIARLLAGEWPAECVVNPQVKERFLAR